MDHIEEYPHNGSSSCYCGVSLATSLPSSDRHLLREPVPGPVRSHDRGVRSGEGERGPERERRRESGIL